MGPPWGRHGQSCGDVALGTALGIPHPWGHRGHHKQPHSHDTMALGTPWGRHGPGDTMAIPVPMTPWPRGHNGDAPGTPRGPPAPGLTRPRRAASVAMATTGRAGAAILRPGTASRLHPLTSGHLRRALGGGALGGGECANHFRQGDQSSRRCRGARDAGGQVGSGRRWRGGGMELDGATRHRKGGRGGGPRSRTPPPASPRLSPQPPNAVYRRRPRAWRIPTRSSMIPARRAAAEPNRAGVMGRRRPPRPPPRTHRPLPSCPSPCPAWPWPTGPAWPARAATSWTGT